MATSRFQKNIYQTFLDSGCRLFVCRYAIDAMSCIFTVSTKPNLRIEINEVVSQIITNKAVLLQSTYTSTTYLILISVLALLNNDNDDISKIFSYVKRTIADLEQIRQNKLPNLQICFIIRGNRLFIASNKNLNLIISNCYFNFKPYYFFLNNLTFYFLIYILCNINFFS